MLRRSCATREKRMGSKAWNHLHLFWTHLALPNTPRTCFGFLCPRKVRLGVQRHKVNRANLVSVFAPMKNCRPKLHRPDPHDLGLHCLHCTKAMVMISSCFRLGGVEAVPHVGAPSTAAGRHMPTMVVPRKCRESKL